MKNSVFMWQKAVPRQHFIVKAGQIVCETHFRKEDILWKLEHFDATGNSYLNYPAQNGLPGR